MSIGSVSFSSLDINKSGERRPVCCSVCKLYLNRYREIRRAQLPRPDPAQNLQEVAGPNSQALLVAKPGQLSQDALDIVALQHGFRNT